MQRFVLLFLFLLLLFFTLSQVPYVQREGVEPFTELLARVSAFVIQRYDSDAYADGVVLGSHSSGFAVAIRPGCNGVEATLLLWAAMLAFPATWRARALGLVAGMLTIQILNQARIISLFYLGQWNQVAFDWAHLYLWPALIILDALVVFLIWVRMNTEPEAPRGA